MDFLFVSYTQTDKQEHLFTGAFGGALTVAAVQKLDGQASILERLGWGLTTGVVSGCLKETADHFDGGDCSWRDAAATAEGAALGSLLTIAASDVLSVVFTPSTRGAEARVAWRF